MSQHRDAAVILSNHHFSCGPCHAVLGTIATKQCRNVSAELFSSNLRKRWLTFYKLLVLSFNKCDAPFSFSEISYPLAQCNYSDTMQLSGFLRSVALPRAYTKTEVARSSAKHNEFSPDHRTKFAIPGGQIGIKFPLQIFRFRSDNYFCCCLTN